MVISTLCFSLHYPCCQLLQVPARATARACLSTGIAAVNDTRYSLSKGHHLSVNKPCPTSALFPGTAGGAGAASRCGAAPGASGHSAAAAMAQRRVLQGARQPRKAKGSCRICRCLRRSTGLHGGPAGMRVAQELLHACTPAAAITQLGAEGHCCFALMLANPPSLVLTQPCRCAGVCRGRQGGCEGRRGAVRELHRELLPDGRHQPRLLHHGQVRARARRGAERAQCAGGGVMRQLPVAASHLHG